MFELGPRDSQIGQLRTAVCNCVCASATSAIDDDTALKTVLSELQVLLVRFHSFLQQPLLGVQSLNLEVVGQLRLIQQSGVLEIRCRRLRDGGVGRHVAPYAAPHVGLIRHVEGNLEDDRCGPRSSVRNAWRTARPSPLETGLLADADGGPSGAVLRLGGEHVLIGDADVVLECVQTAAR